MPATAYPLPFSIDHVIARQHGGKTVLDNLALACLHCNRHKGPNIAGTDPSTNELTRLFNPRLDLWSAHFSWHGPEMTGNTPIGRASIRVLAINASDFLEVRRALMAAGEFPVAH